MISSNSFIVSGLIFRSFIHFEFIFVYGIRKHSNFIPFISSGPVFPATITEGAIFAQMCILASFVKNQVLEALELKTDTCILINLLKYWRMRWQRIRWTWSTSLFIDTSGIQLQTQKCMQHQLRVDRST